MSRKRLNPAPKVRKNLFTPIGMALVDKVGRKALLLFGCAGLALCMADIPSVSGLEAIKPPWSGS